MSMARRGATYQPTVSMSINVRYKLIISKKLVVLSPAIRVGYRGGYPQHTPNTVKRMADFLKGFFGRRLRGERVELCPPPTRVNELRHRVVTVALEEAVGRACSGFRVGLGLG